MTPFQNPGHALGASRIHDSDICIEVDTCVTGTALDSCLEGGGMYTVDGISRAVPSAEYTEKYSPRECAGYSACGRGGVTSKLQNFTVNFKDVFMRLSLNLLQLHRLETHTGGG
jgi:hypothetical protein